MSYHNLLQLIHHSPNTFLIAVFFSFYLLTLFHVYLFPYYSFNKPRRISPQGLCIHHRYSCNVIPTQDLLNCYFHRLLYSHTTLSSHFNFFKAQLLSMSHTCIPHKQEQMPVHACIHTLLLTIKSSSLQNKFNEINNFVFSHGISSACITC